MKKFDELEERVKAVYGLNFISLSDSTQAFFGRNFREEELGNLCSFSMGESSLRRYAEEGFIMVTVPCLISVRQICSLVPEMFIFNLGEHEKYALNKEMIKPGRYLIKKEPRHLSSGAQAMRQMGLRVEEDPKLIQLMYLCAVCELLNRKLLIEKVCVVCREEVIRRYGKTHLCFQRDSGKVVKIGAWPNQIPSFELLPVKLV